jgi:hypothetical protein
MRSVAPTTTTCTPTRTLPWAGGRQGTPRDGATRPVGVPPRVEAVRPVSDRARVRLTAGLALLCSLWLPSVVSAQATVSVSVPVGVTSMQRYTGEPLRWQVPVEPGRIYQITVSTERDVGVRGARPVVIENVEGSQEWSHPYGCVGHCWTTLWKADRDLLSVRVTESALSGSDVFFDVCAISARASDVVDAEFAGDVVAVDSGEVVGFGDDQRPHPRVDRLQRALSGERLPLTLGSNAGCVISGDLPQRWDRGFVASAEWIGIWTLEAEAGVAYRVSASHGGPDRKRWRTTLSSDVVPYYQAWNSPLEHIGASPRLGPSDGFEFGPFTADTTVTIEPVLPAENGRFYSVPYGAYTMTVEEVQRLTPEELRALQAVNRGFAALFAGFGSEAIAVIDNAAAPLANTFALFVQNLLQRFGDSSAPVAIEPDTLGRLLLSRIGHASRERAWAWPFEVERDPASVTPTYYVTAVSPQTTWTTRVLSVGDAVLAINGVPLNTDEVPPLEQLLPADGSLSIEAVSGETGGQFTTTTIADSEVAPSSMIPVHMVQFGLVALYSGRPDIATDVRDRMPDWFPFGSDVLSAALLAANGRLDDGYRLLFERSQREPSVWEGLWSFLIGNPALAAPFWADLDRLSFLLDETRPAMEEYYAPFREAALRFGVTQPFPAFVLDASAEAAPSATAPPAVVPQAPPASPATPVQPEAPPVPQPGGFLR